MPDRITLEDWHRLVRRPRRGGAVRALAFTIAYFAIALPFFMWLTGALAADIPFCERGKARVDCVVDGDTVWIGGEKIRLKGIDAPEPKGRCHAEWVGAANAAERLRQLVGQGVTIERDGEDRYGRTLARLRLPDGRTAGEVMIEEGVARPYRGRRESWC